MTSNNAPSAPVAMVIGGASSGKSSFAEAHVIAQGARRIYIATAQAFDAEMARKIEDHRAARSTCGWTTVETSLDVVPALQSAECPVLLDCATMWLSNLMFAEEPIAPAQEHLLQTLRYVSVPVTVVTNEVGLGGVSDNAMARRFGRIQGGFNAALAAQADLVVHVIAGLPQVIKGQLP